MDWIEVADDAVKIGLGAIISWLATYAAMKRTHTEELQKISYIRKLDSLEQVSDKAEEHFDSLSSLSSRIGGIYSGRHQPDPEFSDEQWKSIHTRDKRLLETKHSLDHAIARLRLLSAKEAADCLKQYVKVVSDFRDKMILQHQTPTKNEYEAFRDKAKDCIARFHEAMSAAYLDQVHPTDAR